MAADPVSSVGPAFGDPAEHARHRAGLDALAATILPRRRVVLPVTAGCRTVELLPRLHGRYAVVDATGAALYGIVVLGELLPLPDDRYVAHDPTGQVVGEGVLDEVVALLFDRHPQRHGVLDQGAPCPPDQTPPGKRTP